MNAVIHLLKTDCTPYYQKYLDHNKSLYNIEYNHFLISDVKNPNKSLYNNFEQIFYCKDINFKFITYVLKTLINLKYKKCIIINSNIKKEHIEDLFELSDFLNQLTVVNNIVDF